MKLMYIPVYVVNQVIISDLHTLKQMFILSLCQYGDAEYFVTSGLDIGLVGPVARGASRFENLLAPQKTYWPGGPVDLKTYWPPKKLTGPYLKTKLARRKKNK